MFVWSCKIQLHSAETMGCGFYLQRTATNPGTTITGKSIQGQNARRSNKKSTHTHKKRFSYDRVLKVLGADNPVLSAFCSSFHHR